jgi:hypothetical protein
MPEEVSYVINLKDLVSGKIDKADGHVKHFEKSLGGVHNALSGLGGMALKAFAVFEAFDFIKESVKDFNEYAQANAQLTASLQSTGNAAGITATQLHEQSEKLAKSSLFDDKLITRQQSILLTFTQIKGAVYNDAMPAILDLSSKMGEDLQSATVQVGKALNDPIRGMTALRRVGVAFSEDQQKVIKSLVQTGHLAQAQGLILKELNTEFGGSATANAMVGTGPFVVLGHMVDDIKEKLGGVIVDIAKTLLPILTTGLTIIADVFKFISDNIWIVVDKVNELFESIGVGFKKITPDEAFHKFIDILKKVGLFLKPIGDTIMPIIMSVINGVKSLIAPLMQFAEPLAALMVWIRDIVAAILTYLPPVIDFIFMVIRGVIDVLHTLYVFLEKIGAIKLIGDVLDRVWFIIKQIGVGLAWIWDNTLKPIFEKIEKWYEKLKSWLKIKSTVDVTTNHAVKTTMEALKDGEGKKGKLGIRPPATGNLGSSAAKVSGSKVTNIQITIGKLSDIVIKTTNIKESYDKIKDEVTKVLLAAVNDSQLVVGS